MLVARLRGSVSMTPGPNETDTGDRGDATAAQSRTAGWGRLLALGVSGGLVPCWDAIVLMLWSATIGQLAWAFYLLLSFSVGLATVLVAVGVLAVKARGFLSSRLGTGRLVRALPIVSAALILVIGVALCLQAIWPPSHMPASPGAGTARR
jgi:ABC-type nickel/cobalt efflux system permease component RcnA